MAEKNGSRGTVDTAPDLSAAEIHCHTLASDGMATSMEVVEGAKKLGLSVVCITDHDTVPGDIGMAVERGLELGVEVVSGQEITTRLRPLAGDAGVHILGLFLERRIREHMTVAETVDAIHDEGGLAVIPIHLPFGISHRCGPSGCERPWRRTPSMALRCATVSECDVEDGGNSTTSTPTTVKP